MSTDIMRYLNQTPPTHTHTTHHPPNDLHRFGATCTQWAIHDAYLSQFHVRILYVYIFILSICAIQVCPFFTYIYEYLCDLSVRVCVCLWMRAR